MDPVRRTCDFLDSLAEGHGLHQRLDQGGRLGPDEVRAWPIRQGATAPEAAGRIHSDLERGFIRADTITYDALVAAGSEKAAREANQYRLNGKEYIVKDGDIIEIRFNV